MTPLSELFDVRYGHSLELNRLKKTDPSVGIPFVSRRMGNNGVSAYVEPVDGIQPSPAGELSCALSGNGVLSTFVQEKPFYTAFHVACLRPKQDFSVQELLYYATCIRANRYRYSWGRQANRTLRDIPLPEPQNIPEWVHEADLNCMQGKDAALQPQADQTLNQDQWRSFRYDSLFDIERGRGPRIKDLTGAGSTPFITSTDGDNGFTGFTTAAPLHPGNVITVNRNGSVAEAFYQPVAFCSTEDVHVFRPKFDLNPYIALFICTLIRQERYRFGYGRKWGIERMNKSIIRLPVTATGEPDWSFMEAYIKSLAFSSQVA